MSAEAASVTSVQFDSLAPRPSPQHIVGPRLRRDREISDTAPRCMDTARSPVPSRFNSSIKRLWSPRASLPVKAPRQPGVTGMRPRKPRDEAARAGFLARQECRSHLHGSAPGASARRRPSCVADAARGDHRHIGRRRRPARDARASPISESSAGRRNEPRCAPASKPEATMASRRHPEAPPLHRELSPCQSCESSSPGTRPEFLAREMP